METYKIVRMYFRRRPRTIRRGLTLDEAKEHCRNPETSSETATGARARRRTLAFGRWFDGYDKD